MYKIHILKYADWFAPGTTSYDHAYGIHAPQKICLVGFLVQGNGRNIMIDTGMDGIDQTYTPEDKERWDHLSKSRDTADLLKEKGLTLDDIDTVILTHLHFDHYINAPLYKKARFHVPRIEWEYIQDPLNLPACPIVGFPREPLAYLAGEAFDRLTLTEDGDEPVDGIKLHWTGGHSPGHMVVSVPTKDGKVIVVGDAFYLYEQIEKDIPLGYRTNVIEVMQGYRFLREQKATLLPAHDYDIFNRHPDLTIG